MWEELSTADDIQNLLDAYGGFHDSCLKEVHYCSGMSVSSDLSMEFSGNAYARLIFQRQNENSAVIEMEFSKLKRINIPDGMDFFLILGVSIRNIGDVFYFVGYDDWDPDTDDIAECLWVSSEKIRWRIRENDCLGDREIYAENN